MMPDLGKYALTVLSAYGVTFGLVLALVAFVLLRARNIKRMLAAVEERTGRHG